MNAKDMPLSCRDFQGHDSGRKTTK